MQLSNLTTEQKEKIVAEINSGAAEESTSPDTTAVKTEVVSVASEEKRTGTKIPVPNPEELVVKASLSLIDSRRAANALMPTMSKRGLIRAFNAILDIPTNNIPVLLQTDEEKRLFMLGQRILMDRYIILTHHIKQEYNKVQAEKQLSEVSNVEKENAE